MIHITNSKGRAEHAELLMGAEGTVANLINAATTKKDDFERILEGTKEIQELKLPWIEDFQSQGLMVPVAITDTVISKQYNYDFDPASIGIEYAPMGDDESRFGLTSTPNPIIWKDFSVPWRQEGFNYKTEVGRNRGLRQVAEKGDSVLFEGDTDIAVTINGSLQKLYGLASHPSVTEVTISDWTSATTSLLTNVNSMMNAFYVTNKVTLGPSSVMMYVASNFWTLLRQQAFSAKGDNSFYAQILADYPEIIDIKPAPSLTTKEVVMVLMEPEYVQFGMAQAPVVIPHVKDVSIAPMRWTAYMVGAPLIHVDANGLTGIVHGVQA